VRRIVVALPVAAVIALAGCGSTLAKSATQTITLPAQPVAVTASSSQPPTATTAAATGAHTTARVKTTLAARTISSSTSTSTSTPAASAKTRAAKPKQKSPVPCLVRAGLLHAGRAAQFGTWQGTDPVSHKPIYVDGPYKSVAAAKASASTLTGVEQVQRADLWVVSASLRGGTGPAVKRVATCLRH
jgi:hypothetical protein